MRARKFSQKLIITVALLAVTAAACGSSSKGASSSTTPTSAASSSAGSPTTAAGSSVTPTTAKPKSFSGDSGGSFCNEIRDDTSAFNSSDIATKTPADLKSLYSKLVPALEHAQSKAPDAIKGDFGTFVTFFKKLNDAFKAANYNFENLDPTKFASLDSPAIQTASTNIENYVVQVCHIKETTPTT
jgi:hypothetical protein